MAVVATLDVVLGATTKKFDQGLKRSQRLMNGFTGAVGKLAAAAGAGLAFKSAISAADEFQVAMQNSLAIMGDVTSVMREDMVSAAQSVALQTKFSAKEAAEAYFFLASAGLDAAQSMAALPQVAKFAQAGNFDLALATDLLTDAQSALGLSSKNVAENMRNMARVSDVLVKANTIANASAQEFSEALTNKAGAALRDLNKSVEEGVGVLAVFSNQGLKGAAAGTALGIVMRDLQSAAVNNLDTWDDLGVNLFDAQDNMRNVADVVGDLTNLFSGMSDKQKKLTAAQLGFQDKSFGFIQSLLGQQDAIRGFQKQLEEAGGITEEVASKQLTPFQEKMNVLKATFEAFSIDGLTPFLDSFGSANELATGFGSTLAIVLDVVHSMRVAWLEIGGLIEAAKAGFLDLTAGQLNLRANITGEEKVRQQSIDFAVSAVLSQAKAEQLLSKSGALNSTEGPGAAFLRKLQEAQVKATEASAKELKGLRSDLKGASVLQPANL